MFGTVGQGAHQSVVGSNELVSVHDDDVSFLQQYRIHMDIGNSKNYLGISAIITIT